MRWPPTGLSLRKLRTERARNLAFASNDALATLRRNGEPYQLAAGELVRQTMVTTGAITNRIDRLEERGFVERVRPPEDRRKVFVRLTDEGLAAVDSTVADHMATEDEILSPLDDSSRTQLADLLRAVLLELGDTPTAEP